MGHCGIYRWVWALILHCALAGGVCNNQAFGQVPEKSSLDSSTSTVVPQEGLPEQDGEKRKKSRQRPGQVAKRRQLVLDFVSQHFSELEKLLRNAEQTHETKFNKAINRIAREVVLLNKIEANQPQKFETAVERWKLKTKIEILIARYAKTETEEQLDERLRPLVQELVLVRKEMFAIEREIAATRVLRLDRAIKRLEINPGPAVKSNLKQFQESADKIRNARRPPASIFQQTTPATDDSAEKSQDDNN